jgi:NAD(P)-dependent dehydrogenase (short-subunit alcohol dehydrogenase family)
VALVTGAARGIGRAIAEAFHREGASVVVTDIDPSAQNVAKHLAPPAQFISLDVRVERQWQSTIANVLQRWGRLDVVVNNAGITGFDGSPALHDPEQVTLETWRAVFATNVEGTVLGCKHGIAAMRMHQAGSIINLGSRSGVVGIPGAAAYAASKAAVRNHTKTVALYCAEQGLKIRCNVIQPAAILTPMWDAVLGEGPDRAERMAAFVADTPLRRFGTPEEVAAIAVYLASDESGYVTGSEFNVDGGLLAGSAAHPTPPTR